MESRVEADLNSLYNHFKNINTDSENNEYFEIPEEIFNDLNMDLNGSIPHEEIEIAGKTLKNNKAHGLNQILNEHIKVSLPIVPL